MSRTDKFMPLYIADYLGDTSHLGMAEHGAYLLLLMHYWRTQQALPDDEQQLARIARGTRAQWKAVAPIIRPFFKEVVLNGLRVLVHSRVEREMVEAKKRSEAKQRASRIANGVRWASQTDNSGIDLESRTAPPSPSQDTVVPSSEAKASSDGASRDLVDLKKQVWKEAKALGIKGPAIGEMFKLCGQDTPALHALVLRCKENHAVGRAMDPTSWCFAELHPKPTGPPKPAANGSAEADWAEMAKKNKAMLG